MGFWGELCASVLLFCLVFGMSATVEMKSLRKQIQNSKALGIGVLMQFVVLPFVGFCVVKALALPSTTGVILLVITSSPGGSYSNWWCSIFNAELALSVTMTTISTLLSVVMLPLNLVLYTKWAYSANVVDSLNWTKLVVSLVVVISGIGGGLWSSYRAEQKGNKANFHKTANRLGNVAGISLVALSIMISSQDNDDGEGGKHSTTLWDQDAKFYIGVSLPAILGLLIAVKLASHYQLEKPERVAVAVEACYQNTGIATSVAMALYKGEQLSTAIGVPLFYGLVEAALLAIFCTVCWKRGWTKAPPNENCCTVICNSYETHDDDATITDDATVVDDGEEGTHSPAKHEVNVQVDLGSTDEENGIVVTTSKQQTKVGPETELTPTTTTKQVVLGETTEGAVHVMNVEEGTDGDELPCATPLERTMAMIRARAAGYGLGIQNEERGLRSARGPVTLGLSQVPTPDRKKSKKKREQGENEIPAKGKSLD